MRGGTTHVRYAAALVEGRVAAAADVAAARERHRRAFERADEAAARYEPGDGAFGDAPSGRWAGAWAEMLREGVAGTAAPQRAVAPPTGVPRATLQPRKACRPPPRPSRPSCPP